MAYWHWRIDGQVFGHGDTLGLDLQWFWNFLNYQIIIKVVDHTEMYLHCNRVCLDHFNEIIKVMDHIIHTVMYRHHNRAKSSMNPHRCRSVYADARTTNGITLLWCPTTAASDPPATLQMLVVRLVLSRLDFGNSVLVGITACLLRRLQSVMNAGARLIFQLRRSDHITDGLLSLHWLWVPEWIQY